MNQTVQSAYDEWLSLYLTNDGCPAGTLRIHRGGSEKYDTVSESIAWGMLITVLMDNRSNNTQNTFDKLWKYYNSFLTKYGLMAWHISKDGKIMDNESATEADENIAMALLYADKQWGSNGSVNYRKEAIDLTDKIMKYEVEKNTYVLKPGINWGGSLSLNPAYFNPAFYRIWAAHDGTWIRVNKKCSEIYDIIHNSWRTGLFPDWCKADGSPTRLGYNFYYDACQVPLKIGLDYLWNGYGSKYLLKLNTWLMTKTGGNPQAIVDGYQLGGTAIGKYHNASFVGPLCISAMADTYQPQWLDAIYADLVDIGTGGNWGYYQDTLRLFSLLIVSGNVPDLWR
ncbi:MAG: glycosyl hydrolase family 8 [bacterium]